MDRWPKRVMQIFERLHLCLEALTKWGFLQLVEQKFPPIEDWIINVNAQMDYFRTHSGSVVVH